MAQEARYRGHVRAVCDEQAGVGVPQGVDVQILRQTVQMHNSIQRTRSLPRSRQASCCRVIFVSAANMDYSTSRMATGRCSCKERAAATAISTGYSPSIPVTGGWRSWITASAKACISETKAPV